MRKGFSLMILPYRLIHSWLRGSERLSARPGQAQGKLGAGVMAREILFMWKQWRWPAWGLSIGFFLILMTLNYLPYIGGYLWLGAAPALSAGMLQLALHGRVTRRRTPLDWIRWVMRCGVLNYTILAWFFFFLVCGAAVAVLFAGLLDWFLIRIPFKRAWSFSFLHLAWILPLVFFLGVMGKAFRYFVGAYLALPLVAERDGGVLRSIRASRITCRGKLGVVALWMIGGWVVSFLPPLFYLGGTGLLISGLTERMPGTFRSLWTIYAESTVLLMICFGLALLAWPFGFMVQAAAYRRVFIQAQTDGDMPSPVALK